MTEPDEFDQFYKDVRTRLLLLTYCLTGDLPSSRAAVRDAFVVAWHHWRKVSRLEDPEAWVRAHACRHAAAPAHGEAVAPREGPRPRGQGHPRRPGPPVDHPAPGAAADRADHQLARRRWPARSASPAPTPSASCRPRPRTFALHREIRTTERPRRARGGPRARREPPAGRGPRSSGARAPPAAVPTPSSASPRRPPRWWSPAPWSPTPPAYARRSPASASRPAARERPPTPGGGRPARGRAARRRQPSTGSLPGGRLDGRAHRRQHRGQRPGRCPASESRYAAPQPPDAALVRTFGPGVRPAARARPSRRSRRRHTVVQTAEVVAQRAGRRPRLRHRGRLVRRLPRGPGPAARDLRPARGRRRGDAVRAAHLGRAPTTTIVAGVARTGSFTTTTVSTTPAAHGARSRPRVAKLLARGVDRLCDLPEAGACSTGPKPRPATAGAGRPGARRCSPRSTCRPSPASTQPWVGTEPRKALDNAAATDCDEHRLQRRADDATTSPGPSWSRRPKLADRVRPHRDRRHAAREAGQGVRRRRPRASWRSCSDEADGHRGDPAARRTPGRHATSPSGGSPPRSPTTGSSAS